MARFLIIPAALAAAGCGGGSSTTTSTLSKQEYATKLHHAAAAPLSAGAQQVRAVDPSQRHAAASAVATVDAGLKKASQQIAALDPPSVVAGLNADIVKSFNLYEKSVTRFEQALRSGTHQQLAAQAAAVTAAQHAFLSTLTQIATQLRSKGIPLPGP